MAILDVKKIIFQEFFHKVFIKFSMASKKEETEEIVSCAGVPYVFYTIAELCQVTSLKHWNNTKVKVLGRLQVLQQNNDETSSSSDDDEPLLQDNDEAEATIVELVAGFRELENQSVPSEIPAKKEPESAFPAKKEPESGFPSKKQPAPGFPSKKEPGPGFPAKKEPEPAFPAKKEPEPACLSNWDNESFYHAADLSKSVPGALKPFSIAKTTGVLHHVGGSLEEACSIKVVATSLNYVG